MEGPAARVTDAAGPFGVRHSYREMEEAPLLLVADAQRLVAETLAISLRHAGFEVIDAYPRTGDDAVATARERNAGVVLMDYWMPVMTGPAATRLMLERRPDTKVMLFSWSHGPTQVQEALAAGAAAFIPRGISFGQLVEAIRRATSGEPLVYAEQLPEVLGDINDRADEPDERVRRLKTLTAREIDILQHLCEGHPSKHVAVKLGISVGTLKNHIHRILTKTGARTQLEAINMARYEGIIREMGPPRPLRRV